MRITTSRLATIVAAGVLAFGAAACGDDEADTAASTATPAATEAPAEAKSAE